MFLADIVHHVTIRTTCLVMKIPLVAQLVTHSVMLKHIIDIITEGSQRTYDIFLERLL